MKILIGDHNHIDFDGPVEVTDKQIEKIPQFFYNNFFESAVEIDETSEFRTDRLGDKLFRKEWSRAEHAELVRINKNTAELVNGLGRSAMSIDMQRIGWLEDFFRWVTRNNIQLFVNNIEEVVERYIEEQENIKFLKKERKKQQKRRLKYLKKEVKRFGYLLEHHDWTKEHLPNTPGINEAIENTQKELEEAKKKLKEFDE